MDDDRKQHLQMIQCAMERMANCSFQLKSWAITLAFALAAFFRSDTDKVYIMVPICAVIAFWMLDAWYLRQEKLFRCLFDAVRTQRSNADFSMDVSAFQNTSPSLLAVSASPTMLGYYGPLLVALVVIALALAR